MKIYLNVPYKEKSSAKKLGAKWDGITKKWFLDEHNLACEQRWGVASVGITEYQNKAHKLTAYEQNYLATHSKTKTRNLRNVSKFIKTHSRAR